MANGRCIAGHWQWIVDLPFLDHDVPILYAGFTQAQMQPAPANEHCAAVQAATEHGALVVDVRFQWELQAQLMGLPVKHLQAHGPREGNVAVQDRFQVTTVAVHAGPQSAGA
ncbi:hypothetical protein D3C81_1960900 [compost metagenome]